MHAVLLNQAPKERVEGVLVANHIVFVQESVVTCLMVNVLSQNHVLVIQLVSMMLLILYENDIVGMAIQLLLTTLLTLQEVRLAIPLWPMMPFGPQRVGLVIVVVEMVDIKGLVAETMRCCPILVNLHSTTTVWGTNLAWGTKPV